MEYSLYELAVYFLVYSFIGWLLETCYLAIKEHHFYNRGFINLPLHPAYGVAFAILLVVLPTLRGSYLMQYIVVVVVTAVVDWMSRVLVSRISGGVLGKEEYDSLFSGSRRGLWVSLLAAAATYLIYLVLHPLLVALVYLLPELAVQITAGVLLVFLVLDFATVFYAVRKGGHESILDRGQSSAQKLGCRISDFIWKRLRKAYPGIDSVEEEERSRVVFARGICFDKLVWVFFVSALIGDIIEMLYCRFTAGVWMNRSSVLYGTFSFVWGFGAVVLTVSLQHLAGKQDRYVFLAGFLIGGVYEYLCSVFTEVVFGTVFWDYSWMPLNIGGRTNVLYCFFWGILAVFWIKIVYPPMSSSIEKFPPLAGKVMTWVVILFMVCNGLLTAAVLVRYNERHSVQTPPKALERLLDQQYDDEFVERRWPNMKMAE
ncbi:MAG: putative ABC transporter permease [Roseburia sp.]|nr:putative ABC transporter permease [Roseburia sp.]